MSYGIIEVKLEKLKNVCKRGWKSDDSNVVFGHNPFVERLKEYDGEIVVYDFDWGESVGREIL